MRSRNRCLTMALPMAALLLWGGQAVQAGGANRTAERGTPTTPVLNQKILRFANSNLNKKVGGGECTDLVGEAFEAAGARRFPPHGPDADYVWGTEIKDLKQVRPGDIIQFRDAVFTRRKKLPNGGLRISTSTHPHHSAIVAEVRKPGAVFVLIHQNAGDAGMSEQERRQVQLDTIRMQDLEKGKLWFYRPVTATP